MVLNPFWRDEEKENDASYGIQGLKYNIYFILCPHIKLEERDSDG